MHFLYLVVCVLFVSANAASSPRTLLESKEALANYLKQKCLKNSNEKAYQALMEEAKDFYECISKIERGAPKKTLTHAEELKEISKLVCVDVPKVSKCLDDVLEKLKPCLDPETKFLPDFIKKSFTTSHEMRCHGHKEPDIPKLDKILVPACWYVAFPTEKMDVQEKCIPNLDILKNGIPISPKFVLTEEHLCKELVHVNKCVVGVLETSCKDDEYSKYFATFLAPALTTCGQKGLAKPSD